jgi:putative transposase
VAAVVPQACAELDISLRTYQRWTREGDESDGWMDRKGAADVARQQAERGRARHILAVVNSPEFASQPPSQIVPTLVDRGEYLASESTIYRVMKVGGAAASPGPGEEAQLPAW